MGDTVQRDQAKAWSELHGELSRLGMFSDPAFHDLDEPETGIAKAIRFVRYLEGRHKRSDCGWVYCSRHKCYSTGCNNEVSLAGVAILEDVDYAFCPYCGGKIVDDTEPYGEE